METGENKPIYSLFDLQFLQHQNLSDCYLNVQIGQHHFQYCIFAQNQLVGIEHYDVSISKLADLIPSLKWINNDYKSINLSSTSFFSTLIPNSIFDSSKKEKYLNLNFEYSSKLESSSETIKSIDAQNVFGLSFAEKELLNTFFSKASIQHYATPLINMLHSKCKTIEKPKAFLGVHKQHIELCVFNKDGLAFFNLFKFVTAQDIAYYTLSIYEQLKLNPDDIELNISGTIEKTSELYKLLYTYIRHVSFQKLDHSVSLSPVVKELPEHFFHHLIHQRL